MYTLLGIRRESWATEAIKAAQAIQPSSRVTGVKSYRGFGENSLERVCVSGVRFQVAGYPTDSG